MTDKPYIDAEQFDAIASTCRRWSERSLAVARALIVDRRPLTETATEHDMTAQQANVIRSRFQTKAEQYRIDEYKRREPPAQPTLASFAGDVRRLHAEGYTTAQIVAYLHEHSVKTDPASVDALIGHSQ